MLCEPLETRTLLSVSLQAANSSALPVQVEAELTAFDGRVGDLGCSVAISGNTLVIGADTVTVNHQTYSSTSGVAYVFTKSGNSWIEVASSLRPTTRPTRSAGSAIRLQSRATR